MDANQLGLFDLPDGEQSAAAEWPRCGRNRETWTRTATAEVTIIDAAVLHEAVARVEDDAVTIELRADPDAENIQPAPEVGPARDEFDALGWLIWPTEGMEGLLEVGAFRILSVDCEVVAGSVDRATVSWTVTVKLTNVDELRRLAAEAHPGEAGLIADSFVVAWRLAADPFAPLRSIPGTAWRPGKVHVEHLPAKAVGSR